MNARRIIGLIVIVLGVIVLVQGGFSFTKKKETANLGPVELSYSKKERVAAPQWLGIVAVVAGAALLLVPGKN
jgi:drug/metabolite transporter (DMT)-like permease